MQTTEDTENTENERNYGCYSVFSVVNSAEVQRIRLNAIRQPVDNAP